MADREAEALRGRLAEMARARESLADQLRVGGHAMAAGPREGVLASVEPRRVRFDLQTTDVTVPVPALREYTKELVDIPITPQPKRTETPITAAVPRTRTVSATSSLGARRKLVRPSLVEEAVSVSASPRINSRDVMLPSLGPIRQQSVSLPKVRFVTPEVSRENVPTRITQREEQVDIRKVEVTTSGQELPIAVAVDMRQTVAIPEVREIPVIEGDLVEILGHLRALERNLAVAAPAGFVMCLHDANMRRELIRSLGDSPSDPAAIRLRALVVAANRKFALVKNNPLSDGDVADAIRSAGLPEIDPDAIRGLQERCHDLITRVEILQEEQERHLDVFRRVAADCAVQSERVRKEETDSSEAIRVAKTKALGEISRLEDEFRAAVEGADTDRERKLAEAEAINQGAERKLEEFGSKAEDMQRGLTAKLGSADRKLAEAKRKEEDFVSRKKEVLRHVAKKSSENVRIFRKTKKQAEDVRADIDRSKLVVGPVGGGGVHGVRRTTQKKCDRSVDELRIKKDEIERFAREVNEKFVEIERKIRELSSQGTDVPPANISEITEQIRRMSAELDSRCRNILAEGDRAKANFVEVADSITREMRNVDAALRFVEERGDVSEIDDVALLRRAVAILSREVRELERLAAQRSEASAAGAVDRRPAEGAVAARSPFMSFINAGGGREEKRRLAEAKKGRPQAPLISPEEQAVRRRFRVGDGSDRDRGLQLIYRKPGSSNDPEAFIDGKIAGPTGERKGRPRKVPGNFAEGQGVNDYIQICLSGGVVGDAPDEGYFELIKARNAGHRIVLPGDMQQDVLKFCKIYLLYSGGNAGVTRVPAEDRELVRNFLQHFVEDALAFLLPREKPENWGGDPKRGEINGNISDLVERGRRGDKITDEAGQRQFVALVQRYLYANGIDPSFLEPEHVIPRPDEPAAPLAELLAEPQSVEVIEGEIHQPVPVETPLIVSVPFARPVVSGDGGSDEVEVRIPELKAQEQDVDLPTIPEEEPREFVYQVEVPGGDAEEHCKIRKIKEGPGDGCVDLKLEESDVVDVELPKVSAREESCALPTEHEVLSRVSVVVPVSREVQIPKAIPDEVRYHEVVAIPEDSPLLREIGPTLDRLEADTRALAASPAADMLYHLVCDNTARHHLTRYLSENRGCVRGNRTDYFGQLFQLVFHCNKRHASSRSLTLPREAFAEALREVERECVEAGVECTLNQGGDRLNLEAVGREVTAAKDGVVNVTRAKELLGEDAERTRSKCVARRDAIRTGMGRLRIEEEENFCTMAKQLEDERRDKLEDHSRKMRKVEDATLSLEGLQVRLQERRKSIESTIDSCNRKIEALEGNIDRVKESITREISSSRDHLLEEISSLEGTLGEYRELVARFQALEAEIDAHNEDIENRSRDISEAGGARKRLLEERKRKAERDFEEEERKFNSEIDKLQRELTNAERTIADCHGNIQAQGQVAKDRKHLAIRQCKELQARRDAEMSAVARYNETVATSLRETAQRLEADTKRIPEVCREIGGHVRDLQRRAIDTQAIRTGADRHHVSASPSVAPPRPRSGSPEVAPPRRRTSSPVGPSSVAPPHRRSGSPGGPSVAPPRPRSGSPEVAPPRRRTSSPVGPSSVAPPHRRSGSPGGPSVAPARRTSAPDGPPILQLAAPSRRITHASDAADRGRGAQPRSGGLRPGPPPSTSPQGPYR